MSIQPTAGVSTYSRSPADRGDVEVQYTLAIIYRNGTVVSQDQKQAPLWFIRGAEQGDAESQRKVAVAFRCGIGVKQEFERAGHWYKLAADPAATKQTVTNRF